MSTTAEPAMFNGFQSRPKGKPACASGASAAIVQLVLDVDGPNVRHLVQRSLRAVARNP